MLRKLILLIVLLIGIWQVGLAQSDTLRTWPYVCQADSFPVTLSGIFPNGAQQLDSVSHIYRNDSLLINYYFSQGFGPAILWPFQVTFNFPTPQPGNYKIHAKRHFNSLYFVPSSSQINVCTGLNGLPRQDFSQLEIYPNPTTGLLNLRNLAGNEVLMLTDLSGKVLIRQVITTPETQTDLRPYPAGIYMLFLENFKGKTVRKIVKN